MLMLRPQPLVKFDPDFIPLRLKNARRWAPWKALWSDTREKYDKIPLRADRPEYGISTANPKRWFGFAESVAAHIKADGMTAGVGYVMTDPHGIVGIDIDLAIVKDKIAKWAQEVIDRTGGYAEVSPSGKGIRIFVSGSIDKDWANHEVGIEVYAGHTARFLTVTGRHLIGTPSDVPIENCDLTWLADLYRISSPKKEATALTQLPALLLDTELPSIDSLDISPRARDFLTDGSLGGAPDRSRVLHSTAINMLSAGLTTTQVISILVDNEHAMAVALDHRRQDYDRAVTYLWVEHTLKAQDKAASRILSVDDFDDLSADFTPDAETVAVAKSVTGSAAASDQSVLDAFEDLTVGEEPSMTVKAPKDRFAFIPAEQYAARTTRLDWFIQGVLPKAEIVAVFGESGAGKTFWVLDVVARISCGLEWYGKPTSKARVAYVVAEGATGFQDRLVAFSRYWKIDLADLDLHVLGDQPNLLEKTDVKDLIKQIKRLGDVGLVVLDTLAQVTPGADENSSGDMGRATAHCKAIHRTTGATVMLIGHSGKDSSKGLRGWSGIKGALDAQIEIIRTSGYRSATITKLKDGRGEGAEYPFRLEDVNLDFDVDYGDIGSCVVETITPADAANAKFEAMAAGKDAGTWGVHNSTLLTCMNSLMMLDGSDSVKMSVLVQNAIAASEGVPRAKFLINRALSGLISKGILIADKGFVSRAS